MTSKTAGRISVWTLILSALFVWTLSNAFAAIAREIHELRLIN